MPTDDSQTGSAGSGEQQADTTNVSQPQLDSIRKGTSKKDPIPESVFEDSGMVQFLQNIYPKYKGWNGASLRSEILKDDNVLTDFANRIVVNSLEVNEELQQSYNEDPSLYENHLNKVKGNIEKRLSSDVLRGETAKQSIIKRTLDLRKNDITSFKGADKEFEHQNIVNREARKHGLDPDFVNAVIEQESAFNPTARSPVGAMGYMQLMPGTAKDLGVDPEDPEQNIKGGVQYLAQQIKSSDSLPEALARYNAGPGNVQKAKRKAKEQGGDFRDYLPKQEETLPYIENIVGSYQQKKGGGFDFKAPVSEFKEIAEDNPDKYRDLGIVDEEGRFLYEGEEDNKAFLTKLENNEDLHRELLSDRYEVFKDGLGKMHNTGAIDEGNVDDMAKAWSIYDQFGSEGLTRYLNVEEHYQQGVPLEDQPQNVQEGINYLKNSSQDGFRPGDYVKAFFGSEDSAVGRFEVTPITRSKELETDVPKDYNNWGRNFHDADNPDEGISNIIDISRRRQQGVGENEFLDKYGDYIPFGQSKSLRNIAEAFKRDGMMGPGVATLNIGEGAKQVAVEAFSAASEAFGGALSIFSPFHNPTEQYIQTEEGLKPVSAEETRLKEYQRATSDEIAHDLAQGLDTNWSQAAKIDILREAQSEEGSFSINDLARTVMANHDQYSEKEGSPVYKIDYENADAQTRTAIDVLRYDEQMSKSFYRGEDGNIIFEPNYLNRVAKKNVPKYSTSLAWERQVVSDEEGNPVGYTEQQAEQGIWQSLGNTMTSFGYQTAKFLDDHAVRPFIEKGLMPLMDEVAETTDSQEIKDYKNVIQQGYQNSWRENLDTEITREMTLEGPGDLLPNVTAWAAPFAAYIYTASKIGNANLKVPSKFLAQAKKVRNKASMEAGAAILKPAQNTKLGLASRKLRDSAKKSEQWNSYGKFALGAIPLEASGGDQWSIFGTGLVDMASRATLGEDYDMETRYKTSERMTQIGMDVLGTEGIALMADNLLLGLPKMAGSYLKYWKGKKSTGRTFVDNTGGFEKVMKPEFSSESTRFFHNLFDGLDNQAIGEVPESLANRVTGRAFVNKPENVNSVSDAVTRFTDEAGEIFSNAKETIRNSIRQYDNQFGAERMTDEQLERRTAQVYDEFMDKTAGNIKGFLENTSGDATLPFRIAQLLTEQAPRFKGQVPFMSDNGPKHLMTRAEANELAARNYRYVVKPAEGGDYARVFEIEDGLWTTNLANRIKHKYTETNIESILDRQARASGIGPAQSIGPTDEQFDQLDTMARNIEGVYGQEVEVDGIRGFITDFDKNGFIIKDVDGVVHRGVKIDELDDIVTQNLGVSQYVDELDDVVEGGQASLIGNRADKVVEQGMRAGQTDYPGVTREGRQLLRNLDQEQTHPAFITDDIRRIADENGVKITDGDSPRDVINKLREQGFSASTKRALDNLGKAEDLMTKFKNHAKSERIVRGTDDEVFQRTGLSKAFMDHVNTFAGYKNVSASTARKFSKLLGVDNTEGIPNMVKNVASLSRWNPLKVGDEGINANRAFLKNNNGTDEHFINVKKVYKNDEPRVWDFDENGRLTFSEKWRRIETNQTLDREGKLPLYTREEIDGARWYRPAGQGEDGVFINVQNPTRNENVTQKEVYSNGLDAVEKEIDGIKHFRLINEGQQTINPTKIKERPAKIYNTQTAIKTPSKKALDKAKEEGQSEIAKELRKSGVSQSVAYGLAGSLIDNMVGTTTGEEDGYKFGLFSVLGALLGSRRIRTKTSNFINGFTTKPIKGLFDKGASATYEVDKSIKNAKERETYGFFVNDDSKRTVDMANEVISSLKGLGDKARAGWDDFRDSRFARSSFMWLHRLDNPVARKLTTALERINESVNEIASIPRTNFNARIESMLADGTIDEGIYRNVADAYDVFKDERGPQIIKDAFPDREITDTRAQEQFQLAVLRNRFGRTRLEDGQLQYHSTPTIDRMYNKSEVLENGMSLGDTYREIDRQLLRNPEFNAFLDSKGTWFDNVKDEWLRQVDGRINTKLQQIEETADRELLQNLVNTNQSYGQWRANLSDAKTKRATSLYRNNPIAKRLIGYHNTRKKFTMLEEGYYPQMISDTRSEVAFRRYVKNEGLDGMSPDKQKEAFDNHYSRVMYEMNTDEPSRRVLRKYDADGQNYDTYYGSRADMSAELDRLANALSDNPKYQELGISVSQNKDNFIRKTQVKQYDDEGNLKLDAEGNVVTEERYFLEQPEGMDTNVFEIQDTYYNGSRYHFKQFYDDLMMGNIVKNSNFLEKPRVKYVPDEFLEVDIDTIRRRYSTDVGRRIHDARYNMFDEQELHNNYLDEVFRYARETQGASEDLIRDMEDRIVSIYNYAHGNLNKSGRELRKEAKWKKLVDMFKNTLFSRFGYGFGWYNTFEWFVVGPHISSFDEVAGTAKLFTKNKQALQNTENLLKSWDIVRREIGSVNPDFERYGNLADDQVNGLWSNRLNKVANYTADFSVAKNIGGSLLGWDVRDWGMARLNPFLGDSFLGSNFVSSSINAQAALGEARHLSRIARRMEEIPEGVERIIREEGKTWTYGEVRRKLGELGVNEDRYDRFIENVDNFSNLVDKIRGEETLNPSEIAGREMPQHVEDVRHIMQRSTEMFHGTNKLYRPETWHSPMGKALSTYSTYPFNFAMQTVNRRVRQPIKDWWSAYGREQLGDEGRTTNAMKMLWNLKNGDMDSLRGMGLSKEAIENIPVDAYRSILKHTKTLGVGTVGYLTMDSVNDILSYPINDVSGGDQWQRLRRWKVLNPGAPQADQMTWDDVDSDIGIDNFMNVVHYALGLGARGSLFGRYGDILDRQYALSRDGIMSLTPMTDMVNSSFKGAMDVARKPVVDWPQEMSDKAKRFLINNTPILGAGIFGELRKGIYEQLKSKNEGDGKGDPRFQTEDTQATISIEDIRTDLE